MNNATVLMPLGPKPIYRRFIKEAINSVLDQTYPVNEILIIDDGANVTDQEMHEWIPQIKWYRNYMWGTKCWTIEDSLHYDMLISLYKFPCNLGFISAFNAGIAVAENNLVIYLAADDTLGPDAVRDAMVVYEANNQKDAWYSLTYESAEGISDIPINAAMVTKPLWNWLGGYPPAAFAGPDAALLSILMVHAPDRIIKVAPGKVNYRIKMHDEQETKVTAWPYSNEMTSIRNKLTANFKPKEGIILK